jgi:hypothetical protein
LVFKTPRAVLARPKTIFEQFLGALALKPRVALCFFKEKLHKITLLKAISSGQSPDDMRAKPVSFLIGGGAKLPPPD